MLRILGLASALMIALGPTGASPAPAGDAKAEIARYGALFKSQPRLADEFDWGGAATGSDGVIRVPASTSGKPSLAIFPQDHLEWNGQPDIVVAFDVQGNEIRAGRLRLAEGAEATDELSPLNRISALLVPEMYSSLPPADRVGFEWLAQVLTVQAMAADGAGIFGATKTSLEYLEDVGVLDPIPPERRDEVVMTRLLIARAAYQYGRAMEEFSLLEPDSARGWLPGGAKLARVSAAIVSAADELGLAGDVSDLRDKLRGLGSADYSRVATSHRQYKEGQTDPTLSEFALGYLQDRILRRLGERYDPGQNPGNEPALAVFRRTFQTGGAYDLVPSLDFDGEPGPELVEMVSFLAGYLRSPEFLAEWNFIASGTGK